MQIQSPEGKTLSIPYFQTTGELPWRKIEEQTDLVMECSGTYRSRADLEKHLEAGAGKVLLSARSATAEDVDRTVVYGINDNQISPDDLLISNSSCTTNAAAHVLKAMEDAFGFEHCSALSIHIPQNHKTAYDHGADISKGFVASYGIAGNLLTAECSLGYLAPRVLGQEFTGRVHASTMYAPVDGGSYMELAFTIDNEFINEGLTPEDIHQIFSDYEKSMPHREVFALSGNENSSATAMCKPQSAILDQNQTHIQRGPKNTLVKVGIWHDTAWGFAPRMLDVAGVMCGPSAAYE